MKLNFESVLLSFTRRANKYLYVSVTSVVVNIVGVINFFSYNKSENTVVNTLKSFLTFKNF